jgi:hypothetical protein
MKFRFCAHDLRKAPQLVAKTCDPNDARCSLAVASMGCLRRLTTSELASCLARGRQLHASRPRYDASGRRVQKAVGSSQTQYIHDLNGNVASELDQNLAWKNAYVHMNGALVASTRLARREQPSSFPTTSAQANSYNNGHEQIRRRRRFAVRCRAVYLVCCKLAHRQWGSRVSPDVASRRAPLAPMNGRSPLQWPPPPGRLPFGPLPQSVQVRVRIASL